MLSAGDDGSDLMCSCSCDEFFLPDMHTSFNNSYKANNISDSRTIWKNKTERNGEEKSNAALTVPMKPQDTHIFLLNFFLFSVTTCIYVFYTQNGRRKKAKINNRNSSSSSSNTRRRTDENWVEREKMRYDTMWCES